MSPLAIAARCFNPGKRCPSRNTAAVTGDETGTRADADHPALAGNDKTGRARLSAPRPIREKPRGPATTFGTADRRRWSYRRRCDPRRDRAPRAGPGSVAASPRCRSTRTPGEPGCAAPPAGKECGSAPTSSHPHPPRAPGTSDHADHADHAVDGPGADLPTDQQDPAAAAPGIDGSRFLRQRLPGHRIRWQQVSANLRRRRSDHAATVVVRRRDGCGGCYRHRAAAGGRPSYALGELIMLPGPATLQAVPLRGPRPTLDRLSAARSIEIRSRLF